MDCKNNPNFVDDNTVVYGHNLHLGQMFSDLQKIKNNELGDDITINIYKDEEKKQYKVFSTYLSEPTKEPINTNISNKNSFIDNVIKKSTVKFNITPNMQDRILTLSTCDNTGKKRIIVHAVELLTTYIEQ